MIFSGNNTFKIRLKISFKIISNIFRFSTLFQITLSIFINTDIRKTSDLLFSKLALNCIECGIDYVFL